MQAQATKMLEVVIVVLELMGSVELIEPYGGDDWGWYL